MLTDPLALVGIAAIGISVVILAVVLVRRVFDPRPSPAALVSTYLAAIERGDASTANAIFPPSSIGRDHFPTDLADTESFCSDASLATAIERISEVRLGHVTRAAAADVSGVDFSFRLGSSRQNGHISLVWRDDEWVLVTGLWRILQVRPNWHNDGDPFREAVEVHLGTAMAGQGQTVIQYGSLIAYPGVYPLSVRAEGWRLDPSVEVPRIVTLSERNDAIVVRPRFVRSPL